MANVPAILILQVRVISFMLAQEHQKADGANESEPVGPGLPKAWLSVPESANWQRGRQTSMMCTQRPLSQFLFNCRWGTTGVAGYNRQITQGAGEMTRQLRALAALAEDQSSVLSSYNWILTIAYNSSSRSSDALFWP